MQYWNAFVAYFREMLPTLLADQALTQFIIIVILCGLFTRRPSQIPVVTAIAAIIYVAVEVAYPAAVEGRDLVSPAVNAELFYRLIALYILLVLPIAGAFGIKSLLTSGRDR